ncbi:MAG: alpha/beta hydrolase [Parvibaculum sp.]|uniref:alpha/beta fold hydrolase n=1 Tax=Parvibaculum sp. TaxID=2024848 RepID=UPI0025E134BB|nr:alpha/beta hydrolase [Parvibaculum sp.]MCE9649165.1 alpha/beta hydrolase [Parvibaculum sp.]
MPRGGQARWITASDGVRLRVIVWPPEAAGIARARGTVFVFGGRTEFAEKYFEVVGELLQRNFAVATVDWRGQGLSDRALADPRKGHVADFADFDRDITAFMGDVAPDLPKPWIALAHSMGGNILMRALHDHPEWFSAAILSAPMLGLRLGSAFAARLARIVAFSSAALGLGSRYLPGGTAKAADEVPFNDNILTHDERRYAVYQALVRAEPKLGLGASTLGWLVAAFRSIETVASPAYLAEIKAPVLIALAEDDGLIDRAALQFAAGHLPQGKLVVVETARHEILIETDQCRARFWAAFDDFVERRVASSSL